MKSAFHQKVSEFNPSGQMSKDQLIKVVQNLQEEVRKLRKENEKLSQQIQHRFQDTLDLRMPSKEREIDTLWKYQQKQFSQINYQVKRIQDQSHQIESILQSQINQQIPLKQINSDKMEIEKNPYQTKIIEPKLNIQKICYYWKIKQHLWKNCREFRKQKRNFGRNEYNNKQVKRKNRSGATKTDQFTDQRRFLNKQIQKTQFELIMKEERELKMQASRVLGFVKNQIQSPKILLSGDRLDTISIFINLNIILVI